MAHLIMHEAIGFRDRFRGMPVSGLMLVMPAGEPDAIEVRCHVRRRPVTISVRLDRPVFDLSSAERASVLNQLAAGIIEKVEIV